MEEAAQPRRGPARWILVAVVVIAAIAGLVYRLGRGHESTDDGQIEGRITQISTRVGGPLIELNVTDNQFVEKGTVLARIDPREYQVAVDRATAELADAEANAQAAGVGVPIASVSTSSDLRTASGGVDEAQAGITVATSQVDAAKAQLLAAEARARERQATAIRASRDVERLKPLVEKEEIAQQQFDAAVATADAARAAVEAAESEVVAARTAVAVAEQRAVNRRSDGGEVQPAAAGERHRQLREGGAARPGEDRARSRPGRRSAPAPRIVGGADGLHEVTAMDEHRHVNPWIVAVAVMFATFMEVLDTTVVNVSLPHIAGNLSATIDESTWVLTSYLVANATSCRSPAGWPARSGASASSWRRSRASPWRRCSAASRPTCRRW
jgi:hypothetical protein